MKKILVLVLGICSVVAFTSCKSSESAYRKAYEKAKQQETTEAKVAEPVQVTPVATAPVNSAATASVTTRSEKVTVVSGAGLKDYNIVCGSFGLKSNAEGLKEYLDGQGYNTQIAYNEERQMYRVIVATFDTKEAAAQARDAFKQRYPNRTDFQGAWLLYRVF